MSCLYFSGKVEARVDLLRLRGINPLPTPTGSSLKRAKDKFTLLPPPASSLSPRSPQKGRPDPPGVAAPVRVGSRPNPPCPTHPSAAEARLPQRVPRRVDRSPVALYPSAGPRPQFPSSFSPFPPRPSLLLPSLLSAPSLPPPPSPSPPARRPSSSRARPQPRARARARLASSGTPRAAAEGPQGPGHRRADTNRLAAPGGGRAGEGTRGGGGGRRRPQPFHVIFQAHVGGPRPTLGRGGRWPGSGRWTCSYLRKSSIGEGVGLWGRRGAHCRGPGPRRPALTGTQTARSDAGGTRGGRDQPPPPGVRGRGAPFPAERDPPPPTPPPDHKGKVSVSKRKTFRLIRLKNVSSRPCTSEIKGHLAGRPVGAPAPGASPARRRRRTARPRPRPPRPPL